MSRNCLKCWKWRGASRTNHSQIQEHQILEAFDFFTFLLPAPVLDTPPPILVDSGRLQWTPADSSGLRWTLVDSGGIRAESGRVRWNLCGVRWSLCGICVESVWSPPESYLTLPHLSLGNPQESQGILIGNPQGFSMESKGINRDHMTLREDRGRVYDPDYINRVPIKAWNTES
ncbi:hypothetical protein BD779DRAFT_1468378 [Infundibulicybe gibba]|nr:hypothetical protein BD779DRAFT_1468378 [Infundibulicybe gibba]